MKEDSAVEESLPEGVCKQNLAGLGMGLSHIAGGNLATVRTLGESLEPAFSLLELKPGLPCFQDI